MMARLTKTSTARRFALKVLIGPFNVLIRPTGYAARKKVTAREASARTLAAPTDIPMARPPTAPAIAAFEAVFTVAAMRTAMAASRTGIAVPASRAMDRVRASTSATPEKPASR